MSNLTLPSGIGDARMMAFLKALRDEIVELKARQVGDGGVAERLYALLAPAQVGHVRPDAL